MNAMRKNENSLNEKLNRLVQLANAYYFYFFNWGFFYWSAGTFSYAYKRKLENIPICF